LFQVRNLIIIFSLFQLYGVIYVGDGWQYLTLVALLLISGLQTVFVELYWIRSWILKWFGYHQTFLGKGIFYIFVAGLGFTFTLVPFPYNGNQYYTIYFSWVFPIPLVLFGIVQIVLYFICGKMQVYDKLD